MPETNDEEQELFKKFNSLDLLSTLAALHLIPENHGLHSGIEQLTLKAIRNYNLSKTPLTKKGIDQIEIYFNSIHEEIDTDGLYTELLPFHGGDKLILTAGSQRTIFSLNILISTVVQAKQGLFPDIYKRKVLQAAEFLLTISDIVLKKADLTRYLEGNNLNGQLRIPTETKLESLKEAVSFSQKDMFIFCNKLQTSRDVFDEFLLNKNDLGLLNNEDSEQLIRCKPLILTEQGFVLMSPAAIGYALFEYLVREATRQGCLDKLKTTYRIFLWHNLQYHLNRLRFKRIEDLSAEVSGVYQFDNDKIAVIHLSGQNTDKLYQAIKTEPALTDNEILDIEILVDLDQEGMYAILPHPLAKSLAMFPEELYVFANTKDTDALDLFKFTVADGALVNNYFPTFASFIDRFFYYRQNDDSFYTERDNRLVIPQIMPGYGSELYVKARKKDDVHLVVMPGKGRLQLLEVYRADKLIPVYYSPFFVSQGQIVLLVEDYPQPLWVKYANPGQYESASLHHMVSEIGNAITYWLTQLKHYLFNYLKNSGSAPITIVFDFDNTKQFEQPERNFERTDNLLNYFKHSVSGQEIKLTLPGELLPYLYGSDNEGERTLVKALLLSFNTFIEQSGQPTMTQTEQQITVDGAAPLGNKKKIFILDTSDNIMLDPSNLKQERYIQDYDVSVVLDKIIALLGNPDPKEFTKKKEKNEFANDIVQRALLPFLRQKLSQYDQAALIKRLIGQNEALIRKREILRIQTPTRIACFVSIEQQEQDLLEETEQIDRTTIATRALIEQVAAEAPRGTHILSTAGMDELIAIMDQVITWGSVSDQVNFELLHIGLAILPSGRVGSDKETIREVFNPFQIAKAKENVQDASNSFENVFPQLMKEPGQPIPVDLNRAFKSDYKISLNRLMDFIQVLIAIGFQQKDACVCKPLNELFGEINALCKEPFTIGQFNAAIEYLSLVDRGKFNKLPTWAEEFDIQPWRFNRRLSFLRKPLIITGRSENRVVWWGIRHLAQSRIYLADQIQSGRFRGLNRGTVAKVLGTMANERGAALIDHLINKIESTDLIIDRDVYIRPEGKLVNHEDLGDIDIFIIDKVKKILYSLECKSMAPSRNIREMSGEIDKLFGDGTEKGWVDRHQDRHNWLSHNLAAVGTIYDIDLTVFTVKSFLITEEAMLTPHLKGDSLPFPFLTRYDFDNFGKEALEN